MKKKEYAFPNVTNGVRQQARVDGGYEIFGKNLAQPRLPSGIRGTGKDSRLLQARKRSQLYKAQFFVLDDETDEWPYREALTYKPAK